MNRRQRKNNIILTKLQKNRRRKKLGKAEKSMTRVITDPTTKTASTKSWTEVAEIHSDNKTTSLAN